MSGQGQLRVESSKLGVLRADAELGSGSQGRVWRARAADGSAYALKLYWKERCSANQFAVLEELVRRGSPHPRFLWPLDLVESATLGSYGYVMHLRDEGYVSLGRFVKGRVWMSIPSVIRLGFELAHSFQLLHAEGLCYRDISLGNAFFRPENGAALICDNDNVGVNGQTRAEVLGTPPFIAPEILEGKAAPSTYTDRHSIAVLLFHLLFRGNPLDGRRTRSVMMDEATKNKFYGSDALFVFDPEDRSNGPVEGVHDHVVLGWNLATDRLRQRFVQSLATGLHEPSERLTSSSWCTELIHARNQTLVCGACGEHTIWSSDHPRCRICTAGIHPELELKIAANRIILHPGATVVQHHLDLDYDIETVVAEVKSNPRRPTQVGLVNRSHEPWEVSMPDGDRASVAPGSGVGVQPGMRVQMGGISARITRLRDAPGSGSA